jgi:hypothetical protein
VSLKIKIFFAVWLGLLLSAFAGLNFYAAKAGEAALPAREWPGPSRLARAANTAELLLFLHPQCSCSRATVSELERLLPSLRGKVHVSIVFFKPEGQTEAWVQSSLWSQVHRLPNVSVVEDASGEEAKMFDVKTSGQVILFDPRGHLSFAGGITPARGHEGDNQGSRMIRSPVTTNFAIANADALADSRLATTSIFGCSFASPFKKLAGVFL